MLNLIAIDTSTEGCSVALSWQGQLIEQFELCPQSHSTILLPMIDAALKQADCSLQQLDGLVFGQGPGSFTGVRIGVGVAQGLAFSAELPVVGVSTLQAMAQQALEQHKKTEVIAAIDARMSEIYLSAYRADEQGIMQPIVDETVIAPNKAADYLKQAFNAPYGVGTGWQTYQDSLAPLAGNAENIEILFPNAAAMLTLASVQFQAGNAVAAEQAQPVYVRDTVSWKKLPGRE
ncbi:tRNA (adenosine(37)-N6)-threonylcarbamoyltransferase complex dimerization subunit type 1 TsaB [Thalassotalea hakodatensis]|uniref:tRNA (adenosine(37)-N6)-threonylcarbamoyltransferase complex dimerization subunit type 1 TsaB n=1 Tax=Thalassotalea hakodatensis TaxID=3030492 RepID=UPI0025744588|nr:tRNA (adenosine(37)-N6)-threonylcarbamoyltransferase complex dimerization subunit type 1 TsaB [Thalassotalea hakodatensis]